MTYEPSSVDLVALEAYAACRRAPLRATELGAARLRLDAAGLVRDCAAAESPMYVAVTDAGRAFLADVALPAVGEQFRLF